MQSNLHRNSVNLPAVPSLTTTSLSSFFKHFSSATSYSASSRRSASSIACSPFTKQLLALTILCGLLFSSVSPKPIPGNDTEKHPDTNGTDIPYSDQPPRSLGEGQDKTHWNRQPHDRLYYLLVGQQNQQYLTVFKDNIYGTFDQKPQQGIFKFLSENHSLVIKHYSHQERFLCLNNSSKLYLREDLNDDCLLTELLSENRISVNYRFDKYNKYLGLDCDPLIGAESDKNQVAFKFQNIPVSENVIKEVKSVKMTKEPPKKCSSQRKKLLQKLTTRWCWNQNLNRMSKDRKKYLDTCKKKHCKNGDSSDCVCKRLENMLDHVKRWKRKCLARRVITWINNPERQTSEMPMNKKVVTELSKLLLPLYPNIARRAQNIACNKKLKNGRRCNPRRKSARVKPVKINPLLDKFQNELVNISGGPKPDSSSGGSPPSSNDKNLQSVLSSKFRKAIEELINHTGNHRPMQHKRRKHNRKTKHPRSKSPRRKNRKRAHLPKKLVAQDKASVSKDSLNTEHFHTSPG
ncbi:uncharacterized protein LOC106069353 [Biomphalaria glabrata]|uniref:Uncharacterized protein LOC106069353 n=1 Tax=Biomphalaria glabrata TaxID=6526 RepID=A0A9U8EEI1_BIOGL|nr:uncharacterized protein LOC106069353 [Biomphalaria glabrata]